MTDAFSAPKPFHIVFLIFDGITQLDFTGPAQVLARLPGAVIHTAVKKVKPIQTDSGFAILPSTNFADCPQADLLCVPGGFGTREVIQDQATINFVRDQAKGAQYVTSVCTGSLTLGAAGLLNGKRATSHWAYTDLLEKFGARHEKARVVKDGNVITAGGVTSGVDFALTVLAEVAGQQLAEAVQLSLEYDPNPPFNSGHPDIADPKLITALHERVYGKQASDLADIIDKL
ncbi:DJ-1/PfpI family protein [Parasphingorhabdus halotolerans]|uniref:DJ-1/PfpI family protein n=1 Tax=Parasphingorhabdus halotolerans TaxID=2725558 RepID=A0A6H2DLK1_9SPHN|nr:DJ-1/PfpI family protein [Parasphingorhabdus halotolerans]QJB69552.1 DJ-1/PfpI family protein [Parasphingorhabdus halotolerans]